MNGDIAYNEAKLEAIRDEFSTAKNLAAKIEEGINASITAIKASWTGSDDVTGKRDEDFVKIQTNMHKICNNLEATVMYLDSKNTALSSASKSWNG